MPAPLRLRADLPAPLSLGDRQGIVWNAALLFGVTQASPDTNFRPQVEYEF